MSILSENSNEKKGTNKIFLIGGMIAILAVLVVIAGVVMLPSPEEEKEAVLANSFVAGSPEFDDYNKNIIISNDPKRLYESYTGLGDIVMQVVGKIRNKGDKTISGLEVNVGMVNTKNEMIRDKTVLVIPKMKNELKPGETVEVQINIPGFERDDDRANASWKVTAISFK